MTNKDVLKPGNPLEGMTNNGVQKPGNPLEGMTNNGVQKPGNPLEGMMKRFPLALTSCILGLLTFFHLFGLEKAVLAIVLGGLALKGMTPEQGDGRKYAYIGILLASLYIVILAVIAVVRGPEIFGLMQNLHGR